MAYDYCGNCESRLNAPTFPECIKGVIECPLCGEDYKLRHDEKDEALIELEQRLCVVEELLSTKP